MTYFRKYKTICKRKLLSDKLNMFVKFWKQVKLISSL